MCTEQPPPSRYSKEDPGKPDCSVHVQLAFLEDFLVCSVERTGTRSPSWRAFAVSKYRWVRGAAVRVEGGYRGAVGSASGGSWRGIAWVATTRGKMVLHRSRLSLPALPFYKLHPADTVYPAPPRSMSVRPAAAG